MDIGHNVNYIVSYLPYLTTAVIKITISPLIFNYNNYILILMLLFTDLVIIDVLNR